MPGYYAGWSARLCGKGHAGSDSDSDADSELRDSPIRFQSKCIESDLQIVARFSLGDFTVFFLFSICLVFVESDEAQTDMHANPHETIWR